MWINERVCDGCGDCATRSTCLSLSPTWTAFGRAAQIHQSSCNQDFSCLEGDCPSFLVVANGTQRARTPVPPPVALPEPAARPDDAVAVRMTGIGGTGVVTVNRVLGTAALLDGLHVAGLDQTGLSQKGGPVISDLRISRAPVAGTGKLSTASCDVYLGFDLLGAAAASSLVAATPARTAAVVSTTVVPTARMVLDPQGAGPDPQAPLRVIEAATRSAANVYLDAQGLSERLLGDHLPAGMMVLGAAWQHGCLPVSRKSLEQAIRLNGAAVDNNIAAFTWGRAAVAAPSALELRDRTTSEPPRALCERERKLVEYTAPQAGALRNVVEQRVLELVDYQDLAYAERYAQRVATVRAVEEEHTPGRSELAETVARQLYRLMAYKDEYEVARLHLQALERRQVSEEFGEGAQVRFLVRPPLLRALGLKRKVRLGSWFVGPLRTLRAAPPARHPLRSVRPQRGSPRRARPDRRVRGDGRRGAHWALRPDARRRGGALRPGRPRTRLRAREASERRALPGAPSGPARAPARAGADAA